MSLKNILSKVNSWKDFKNVLEAKSKLEKGKAFEELTKYYLQYNPVYKSKLKNVWLQREITPTLLKKLNIPSNDQGIDLIAETFEGTYWAIQCKYLQDEDQRLSHRAISTLVTHSFQACATFWTGASTWCAHVNCNCGFWQPIGA